MQNVKKQYGLWTGIAMVVGIVIGSGVFIKAGGVLQAAGGNLTISLLAWLVGGIIMVTSGFCFAIFATRVTKYNGVVDYVEVATNKRFGYDLAWLITTFYYPIIASIVSIMSAKYFLELFGITYNFGDFANEDLKWLLFLLAFLLLSFFVVMNYLSPRIAAKFQISATIIKLIPIVVIAVVGVFAALILKNGELGILNAFSNAALTTDGKAYVSNFGEAVVTTSFAYEGWVCATSINAELKDSKRNLPKALTFGTIVIVLFYLIYFISLSACLGNSGVIAAGSSAPIEVFEKIMGGVGKAIFTIFIMISCLGTVNGVTMSCCRGMYTMSCRGQGICPEKFAKLGKNESVSLLSCIYGYCCMLFMLLIWYLALSGIGPFKYLGAMDEIICAIIYGAYITMYVYIMKNFKDANIFQRYIMPILAIIGSLFFVICGTGIFQIVSNGDWGRLTQFAVFMILLLILMIPSVFFYREKNNK